MAANWLTPANLGNVTIVIGIALSIWQGSSYLSSLAFKIDDLGTDVARLETRIEKLEEDKVDTTEFRLIIENFKEKINHLTELPR